MEELRVRFSLVGEEAGMLRQLAMQECRTPAAQLRFLLLQELDRRGLFDRASAEDIVTTERLCTSQDGIGER